MVFIHYRRLIDTNDILDKPDVAKIICQKDFLLCCRDNSLECTSSLNKEKLVRSGVWE